MRYGVLLVMMVCGCVTEPKSLWPDNVHQFTAPASYEADWQQMEACSGITADFRRVTWYAADSLLDIPGLGAFGFTDMPTHRIALDGRATREENVLGLPSAVIVRHEMLHDLLQTPGHPSEYFGVGGKCFAEVSH